MDLLLSKKHKAEYCLMGYTLIESLVVISIIIIVAIMAFPYLGGWGSRLKLSNAARDIVSDLRLARQYAVSQNKQFKVIFDVDNEQYELKRGNKSFGSDAWTKVEYTRDYTEANSPYHSIDIYSVTNDVVFNPDGSVSSTLVLELRNTKGERCQVSIENLATGFVKSYSWNGSSWE